MGEFFFPIAVAIGGILLILFAFLVGILVIAYAMHLLAGQDPYDDDPFDYEDLYPDKTYKNQK